MVEFIRVAQLEYARKEKGVPTVDDSVGNYLFKKFQRNPKSKIKISGRKLTYEEALSYFESGAMLRCEYEELLRKAKPSSFTQKREEIKAFKFLRSDVVCEIFGNIDKLPDTERRKLISACQSLKSFREYVRPYLEKRLQELPEGFEFHKEKILDSLDSSEPIDDLKFALGNLGMVVCNLVDWNYKNDLAYPENRDLLQDYCKATQGEGAFALARVYRTLEDRLGKR